MDYFKQRRAYRNLKAYEMDVSANQNNLYRELLDYANDHMILDQPFPLKNEAVLSLTGLTKSSLIQARNKLMQSELIKYNPGKKNSQKPVYQIVKLYKDHSKGGKGSVPESVPTYVPEYVPTSAPEYVPTYVPESGTEVLTNTKHNKTSTKRDSRKSGKPTYDDTDINYQLADQLYQKIKQRQNDFKKPNLQRWADDIRLAHEQDGRTYEQLGNMIDWSQSNDFWQANILSAKKLRDKYDQMKAQALKDTKAKTVETAPDWDKLSAEQQEKTSGQDMDAQIAEANERLRKLHEGQGQT